MIAALAPYALTLAGLAAVASIFHSGKRWLANYRALRARLKD